MMSLRVVFVALAAVCAAQAYSVQHDASPIEAHRVSDIFNKIEVILGAVRDEIQKMDQQLKNVIDAAYMKVEEVAKAQGEMWHDAVAKAMKQADKYGVDVSECMAESNALTEVVDNLVDSSRQCIAKEAPAVQVVQKKVDDLLNETNTLLESAKAIAEECESKPIVEAAICSTQLTPLVVQATRLGTHTAKVSLEISVISVKSSAKISVCMGIATTNGTRHAMKIVEQVNKCVLDKINKNISKPHTL